MCSKKMKSTVAAPHASGMRSQRRCESLAGKDLIEKFGLEISEKGASPNGAIEAREATLKPNGGHSREHGDGVAPDPRRQFTQLSLRRSNAIVAA
jgi:hypothetical protein